MAGRGFGRVPINAVLPELGSVNLWAYWYLRIACCAHLVVRGEDTLVDCDRCYLNRGYVCPSCLGARWTSTGHGSTMLRECPVCTHDSTGPKGELLTIFDEVSETMACRAWLTRNFPFGIPWPMSLDDIRRADNKR